MFYILLVFMIYNDIQWDTLNGNFFTPRYALINYAIMDPNGPTG